MVFVNTGSGNGLLSDGTKSLPVPVRTCLQWVHTVTYFNEIVFQILFQIKTGIKNVVICSGLVLLTHWGRVMHICFGNLINLGSDNGLSPGRGRAIIWTNAGILLIGPLGIKLHWNFNRNSNIFIQENALFRCRLRNGVHFVSASLC